MAKQTVWTVTFQLMEACNSIGAFSTKEAAMAYVQRNYISAIMTSGAAEYGEVVQAKHQEIMENFHDMEFSVRNRDDADEVWIDLQYIVGERVQPAMFTLTRLKLDSSGDGSVGKKPDVKFVHKAPVALQ